MNRDELLAHMHDGRTKLEAALSRVDERQMGDLVLHEAWSIKDLLAHVAFWERRAASMYRSLASTGTWQGVSGEDGVDRLNEQALQAGRRLSLEEVRRDEEGAWHEILSVAETAPDVDLFGPDRFHFTNGQPFYGWIAGNTYGHYDEHLPELTAWLEARA